MLPSMNNLNYQTVAAQQCKLHVNIEIYTNTVLFKPISRTDIAKSWPFNITQIDIFSVALINH